MLSVIISLLLASCHVDQAFASPIGTVFPLPKSPSPPLRELFFDPNGPAHVGRPMHQDEYPIATREAAADFDKVADPAFDTRLTSHSRLFGFKVRSPAVFEDDSAPDTDLSKRGEGEQRLEVSETDSPDRALLDPTGQPLRPDDDNDGTDFLEWSVTDASETDDDVERAAKIKHEWTVDDKCPGGFEPTPMDDGRKRVPCNRLREKKHPALTMEQYLNADEETLKEYGLIRPEGFGAFEPKRGPRKGKHHRKPKHKQHHGGNGGVEARSGEAQIEKLADSYLIPDITIPIHPPDSQDQD